MKKIFVGAVFLICTLSECMIPNISEEGEGDRVNTERMEEYNIIASSCGRKADNLRFLSAIKGVNVPSFAAVEFNVFQRIISALQDDIDTLYSLCSSASNMDVLFKNADVVRQKIIQTNIPDDILANLLKIYQKISTNGSKSIVVRSSSTVEDGVEGAFAGLYESVLNLRTFDDFCRGLKVVWASNFSNNAIKYYLEKGIDIRTSFMGVVVQEMINAVASGTAFSVDVSTGYKGISITANYGPEAVVGGESADNFLFNNDLFLIRAVFPEKKSFYQQNASSGTTKVELEHGKKESSIPLEQARSVAAILKIIQKAYNDKIYNGSVDTEFCIDEYGKIYFVQVRPLINVSGKSVFDISATHLPAPIAVGKYSVGGVNIGKIKVIDGFYKLATGELKITPEDIVVAHRTENQWSQFFTKFSGMITMEGNSTAHPMLVAREHGVPCVIGVPNAVDIFTQYDGQWVTIDGFRKKVYLGKLPLAQVSLSKISEIFETLQPESLPSLQESIDEGVKKKKMFQDGTGNVWFVKPDAILNGALLQLQLSSFSLRNALLEKTGIKLSTKIEGEQCAINGKVYEKVLGSLQEQVDWLRVMSLNNFKLYFEQGNTLFADYMKACESFDLSVSSWDNFCEKYSLLCAYMWLSFITRTSELQHTFNIGGQLGIPKVYFSDFERSIQDEAFQEDVEFQKEMVALAKKLKEHFGDKISGIDLEKLRNEHSELFEDLITISKKYKFSDYIDWVEPVSLENVLKRLEGYCSVSLSPIKSEGSSVFYFLDNPEFAEWARLSTLSKIQQNNVHHLRIRGQWLVRDHLLILGQKALDAKVKEIDVVQSDGSIAKAEFTHPEEILRASVEQVRTLIENFVK